MNLTARPYDINWSGNAIWYAFYSAAAEADPSISFEVRLCFRRMDTNAFTTGPAIPLIPFAGKAKINIASLVDAELEFGLPTLLNPNDITACATQTGQFYVEFREITADNNNPAWDSSENNLRRIAIKGGVPEFKFNNNGYWNNYYPTLKPFLSWQLRGRLAAYDERIYLAWFQGNEIPGNAVLKVIYTVYFTDLNLPPISSNLPVPSHPLNIHYLPAGGAMVNLQAINPAKQIWRYTVQVYDFTVANAPQQASEAFLFEIDNRPDSNGLYLLYRGSTGGLDTIRIRGVVEKDPEYQMQQTGRVQLPYYEQGNKITPTLYPLPAQETVTYKGDIGHLKKEEQERLRDIYLQRELYKVENRRWWPVNLSIKSFKLSQTTDKVWSLPVEFSLANDGDKYYAPNVDFGNAYADTNVCNAFIENLVASRQLINGDTICEVTFTFNVAGAAVNKVQYVSSNQVLPFNPGPWNDLAYPYVAPLVLRFPANSFVTVSFRAICPNSYGGLVKRIVIDTSASDTGGGGGGGPTGPNNSRIINRSGFDVVASIRVNGVLIFTKLVKANTLAHPFNFEFFTLADGVNSTIQIELAGATPTSGTIDTNGQVYHGVVDPVTNALVYNGVNNVNGIVTSFY